MHKEPANIKALINRHVKPSLVKLKIWTLWEQNSWARAFLFAAAMWLLSRLVIAVTMLLIAPSLPVPPEGIQAVFGWEAFSYADSKWYERIATSGYEYHNVKVPTIAFFPLFPLAIRGVMSLGLPVKVAGTLVNNIAFLGALIVLYLWVEERHGKSIACWATAVLAWCPLSLFGSVIYSEGLFLLCSTAALRAFDKQQYVWAALWGAGVTAARPTGVVLIPTLLIVAWRERRPARAYVAGLLASGGLLLFSLYCAFEFGDSLAFYKAQRAWRPPEMSALKGWLKTLMEVVIGPTNGKTIANSVGTTFSTEPLTFDFWYPLLFVTILGIGYLLWRFRRKFGSFNIFYGFCALELFLWMLAGDALINLVIVFGSVYLIWSLRDKLSPVAVIFGLCGLALVIYSGPFSADRIAYGIVSLAIALGMVLKSYPRWGYATIVFFAIILVNFALRFSQELWVA
jgi:Gpi18-like mannosyltransferase